MEMQDDLRSKCVWTIGELAWRSPSVRQTVIGGLHQLLTERRQGEPMAQMDRMLNNWFRHYFRDVFEQINIPLTLKDLLRLVVWNVIRQSFLWHHYHILMFGITTKRIYWMPPGILDVRKTVQKILEDEEVPMSKRLWLACHHCIKNFVEEHWTLELISERPPLLEAGEYSRAIMAYWHGFMNEEFSEIERMINNRRREYPNSTVHSCNTFMLSCCFHADGCLLGMNYFWSLLTEYERHRMLFEGTTTLGVFDWIEMQQEEDLTNVESINAMVRYFIWNVLTHADRARLSDKLRYYFLFHTLYNWPEELRFQELLPHTRIDNDESTLRISGVIWCRIQEGTWFHFGWPNAKFLYKAVGKIMLLMPRDDLRRFILLRKVLAHIKNGVRSVDEINLYLKKIDF